MNRQSIYGFLIGVAVLMVAGIWGYIVLIPGDTPPAQPAVERPTSRVDEQPTETTSVPLANEPSLPLEPDGRVPDTTELFPDKDDGASAKTDVAPELARPSSDRTEKIQGIQRELASIAGSGAGASPVRVKALISELRLTLGSDTVGGVDLKQLERTVTNASRIKTLAAEMESIAASPDENDRARIQSIMAEMQSLQDGIPDSASDLRVQD